MPTMAGKTSLRPFLRSRTAYRSFFRWKKYRSNPSEIDIKVVIPTPIQCIMTKTKINGVFHKKKVIKKHQKNKENT